MVQAVGVPGVWQCPKREDHEFMEDPPKTPKARSKKPDTAVPKPSAKPSAPPSKCPKCSAWAKQDDLGFYCDNAVHRGIYRLPKSDEPYWLAHLGITNPLQGVRQSSSEMDGAFLQGIGDIKKGGGSGSGRKRKKPSKRIGSTFFEG